jgi:hypothetical protein
LPPVFVKHAPTLDADAQSRYPRDLRPLRMCTPWR